MHSEITEAMDELATECGRTVTLRRGDEELQVTAIPARTKAEMEDSDGGTVVTDHDDFLIKVSDYEWGEPLPGDELDDLGDRYEASDLGQSMPCWEYSDRGHSYYRIHYSKIGKVP